MKKYDVTVAGYTCVDIAPGFRRNEMPVSIESFFRPGKLIEIDGAHVSLGGIVPNTGLALKKFGKKVFLNGLIGDDPIGIIAKSIFDEYGVSEGIRTTRKAGTAFSIVISPPGVDRIFLESPGCNRILDREFIDYEAVAQSSVFHFGYPPLLERFYRNDGRNLFGLFSDVCGMGTATSLDFSLPDPDSESGRIDWPVMMGHILPVTDIFVPSLEEVLRIMRPSEYDDILSMSGGGAMIDSVPESLIRELGGMIIGCGVKILLIKMAHRGVYLVTGDVSSFSEKTGVNLSGEQWNYRELRCKAYRAEDAKVVGASGAGDTAAAAFLAAIIDGESPEASMRYAAMAGRDSLYCRNTHKELGGWDVLAREIAYESNDIIDLGAV